MKDSKIVDSFYSTAISSVPDKFITAYEKNRELLIKESLETPENGLLKGIKGSSRSSEDNLAVRVQKLESAIIQYSESVQQRNFEKAQKDSQELLTVYSICARDYYDGLRRREQRGSRFVPQEEVRFFMHRLFLDLILMECWNKPGLMVDISSMCYRLMKNWNSQNSGDTAFRNYYSIPAENDIINRYFDNINLLSQKNDVSFLEYMPRLSAFVSKEYVITFLDELYKHNKDDIEREKAKRYTANVDEVDMVSFQRWKVLLVGLAVIVLIVLAAAIGYVFGSKGKADTQSAREQQQIEMDSGTQNEKTEQTEHAEKEQTVEDQKTSSDTITGETGKTKTEKKTVQTGQKAALDQANDSENEKGDYIREDEAVENAESKDIIDGLQQFGGD